jgi:hypothetical protein
MPFTLAFLGVAGITALAWLAQREARAAASTRHSILDAGLNIFDTGNLSIEPSGFPKIEGKLKGRAYRVALIPDTLTIRRLPQLWLDVTLKRDMPSIRGSVAILIRPSGADYYSLTDRLRDQLRLPRNFPENCLIKGQGAASQTTLDLIAPEVATLLRDPKIKEVAVSPRGVRIVRQFAQGNRGHHLILRQSVFEGAGFEAGELESVIHAITRIENALLVSNLVSAA